MENGDGFARQSLQKNPAKLITLMNACCNMSNANIAIEKRKLLQNPSNVPPATGAESITPAPEPIRT